MSKIVEFKMAKGVTAESETEEKWTKKSLELTVKVPAKHSDEEVQVALTRAEYLIDNWLGKPEAEARKAATPGGFDPEELMKHDWKGKKDPDREGQYKKGSLAWGWDFKDKFTGEVIKVLEKGPIMIGEYEFTLGDQLVNVKKKKDTAK